MNKREWQLLEEIVDGALERDGEKRTNFINKRCKGDLNLKKKVTQYLDAIEQSEGFLGDDNA